MEARRLDMRSGDPAPFYLSVHYTAPHSPWDHHQHPAELTGLYRDCASLSCPDGPQAHPWQINSALRGQGERRLELLQGYDTSVKVPFLMSYPGHIHQEVTDTHLLSHCDFLPTRLDYLGIPLQEESLPGKSFAPLLRGETFEENEHLRVFDEFDPVRLIRSQTWKYVHRYPYGPHELYDLLNDPGEMRNLIKEPAQRATAEALKGEVDAWLLKYVDPRLDSVRDPVTGKGQIDRAGVYGLDR